MSMLTHSTTFPASRGFARRKGTPQVATTASAHVAMIKRFVKFAGALVLIAIAVAAVASIKLAIYYPHHFH